MCIKSRTYNLMVRFLKYVVIFILLSKVTINFVVKLCSLFISDYFSWSFYFILLPLFEFSESP